MNDVLIQIREEHSGGVARHLCKLIVPFSFKRRYDTDIKNVLDAKTWEVAVAPVQRFFQHIDRLIDSTNGYQETIGQRFQMTQKARNKYKLPNNPKNPETKLSLMIKERELCTLAIIGFNLYLFETQVGFLVCDIEYDSNITVDAIIEGNYYLKKYVGGEKDCRLCYMRKIGKDQSELVSFNLAALTIEIINDLQLEVDNFFENMPNSQNLKPYQALVYSAVVLEHSFVRSSDSWQKSLEEYLFRLRRSFKESYKPALLEYQIDNNPETIQLFENSYWGVALEGLANIVYLVDDETTNDFFLGSYSEQLVRENYFFIYILALHQRYALLQLSIEAVQLKKASDDDFVNTRAGEITIAQLREKIAFFTLRAYYRQISNNTHYVKLYERISKLLGIDELIQEVHFELEVLSSLAELKEQRRKETQEETVRRRTNYILLVSTVFITISTLSDTWAIFNNIKEVKYPSFGEDYLCLFIFLAALIVTGILFSVWHLWKLIKERKWIHFPR